MFGKKKRAVIIPQEVVSDWETDIFGHLGIDAQTDPETIKECCRVILVATSRLYDNVERIQDGMKPIRRTE